MAQSCGCIWDTAGMGIEPGMGTRMGQGHYAQLLPGHSVGQHPQERDVVGALQVQLMLLLQQ